MQTELQNYNRLKNNLSLLKLTAMAQHLDDYLTDTEKGTMSALEALLKLTDEEVRLKEERAVQGCVKVANFPFLKTMEDFDFSFQPNLKKEEIIGFKSLRFLEKGENIIFLGTPGVGKTHLSVSIGIEAAKNRKPAYFVNCADLLEDLKRAKNENRLEKRLKFYVRYQLLIIDEVGFLPIDEEASKLFFQLISKRYEKRSTIITTNIELSEWGNIFGSPVLANAILDRLLHHSTVVRIVGNSYRMKDILEI